VSNLIHSFVSICKLLQASFPGQYIDTNLWLVALSTASSGQHCLLYLTC